MTPVNTNLVFDKFADCLAAEEQDANGRFRGLGPMGRSQHRATARILKGATSRPNGCSAISVRAFLMPAATHAASAAEQSDTSSSRARAAAKSENVRSDRSEPGGREPMLLLLRITFHRRR
jgi:hypothetical protein